MASLVYDVSLYLSSLVVGTILYIGNLEIPVFYSVMGGCAW